VLHAGHNASVFASLIERRSSNLDLHFGHKYSYIGISYLSKKILTLTPFKVKNNLLQSLGDLQAIVHLSADSSDQAHGTDRGRTGDIFVRMIEIS